MWSRSARPHKGGGVKKGGGGLLPRAGALHQLGRLWRCARKANHEAHWAALFADTDFIDGFAAQFRPLVQTQEVKLLTAAPWGPHP